MKVYASLDNIIAAAWKVNLGITQPTPEGRAYRFTLKLPIGKTADLTYHRRSHEGRLVRAVCWHGYRDFMIELFKLESTARIVTGIAKYEGEEGFYATFPATGNRNIGSMMQPMRYADACDCIDSSEQLFAFAQRLGIEAHRVKDIEVEE